MKPTEILVEEHQVIEGLLASLENAAGQAARGGSIRPGFFIEAADFIKGFTDGCHHRKEEGVLFPALVEAGVPARGGPVEMMLAEHQRGRELTRQLRAAAERWAGGDPSARQAVVDSALGYVKLLRGHIYKENNVLFPLAERLLPPGRQAEVGEAFEHVEHEETGAGIHEKYLGMAAALAKEIGAGDPVLL